MATTEQIQELADLVYASQTTGVGTDVLNAATQAVGIDPNDYMARQEFLQSYGYQPGTGQFYQGSTLNTAPLDEGLAAHYNAQQTAINEYGYLESTEENIANYAGQINPQTGEPYKFIVNDTLANSQFIQDYVNQNNIDSTVATIRDGSDRYTMEYNNQSRGAFDMDNALQWADLGKKKLDEIVTNTGAGTVSTTAGAGIMPGYADVTPPAGGYQTPPANIPDFYRNFTPAAAAPAFTTTTSGTQAMNVPTYQNLFTNQVGQFVDRADTQQSFYQPQTMFEKLQQGGTGPGQIETRLFRNAQGMSMYVTFVGGVPQQYIPPGYFEVINPTAPIQSPQGVAQQPSTLPAGAGQLPSDLAPTELGPATNISDSGLPLAKGGTVKGYAPGGTVTADDIVAGQQQMLANAYLNQAGNVAAPPVATLQPEAIAGSVIESTAGQAVPIAPIVTTPAQVSQVLQANPVSATTAPAGSMTAQTAVGDVRAETAKLTGVTGAPTDTITAQQQFETSLDDIKAAQGNAIKINGPAARQIQSDPITGTSEIISGAANAHTAATFTEAIQHAEATPTKQATVAGQLEQLMAGFEGGETPAWAAGSMRTAMATLSARGLGASSLAGQAVIQAAMEAAIPIAQMDAQTMAQFEAQNLSNRQQRAMLAAQQRASFIGVEFDQAFQARVSNAAKISDIANMNFTADQQIALEDSRAANTMELGNLSNSQAVVMAEAAALANLDMANLNNRQQAEVQNAQNFLQMDMSNLSNRQQAAMFQSQQNVQALFTDQAAENAAQQFNATSENQTQQFFNNLASQTNQFNASQANAMQQFNVDQANTLLEFNADLQSAREMFNAQNYLTVAQANAQWRQSVQTMNTAAINASNMEYAKQVNNLSQAALDQIWMRDRDIMDYAWRSAESAQDRQKSILIAEMQAQAQVDQARGSALGRILSLGTNYLMASFFPQEAAVLAGGS
tara:strand:+ start:625 stop:3501 length:2877 start_codon:yes stop_codon:yes gene_type:complete